MQLIFVVEGAIEAGGGDKLEVAVGAVGVGSAGVEEDIESVAAGFVDGESSVDFRVSDRFLAETIASRISLE